MFTATVIAADDPPPQWLERARSLLDDLGTGPGEAVWLDGDRAADLPLARWSPDWRARLLETERCDIVVQRTDERRRRLLVSDMDSTMITVECIDELADYAGCKAEVAAVTERAMGGELDFTAALNARVALLAGLPLRIIDECLAERVRPTAGARTLLATAHSLGIRSLLVSGGFTHFAEPVARRLGFDRVHANVLEERDGRLTGAVRPPVFDGDAKVAAMREAQREWSVAAAETLAVGDGANDLPMIHAAGLGVAYRAKPIVTAKADAAIRHGDLTALLHAMGVPSGRWVRPGSPSR